MTFELLQQQHEFILLKCISGSKAYGLSLPTSDTDIKGVFILPENEFYGLNYVTQVNNETNDEVYYELKRLFELLVKNNPNILELLATPEEHVLFRHPVVAELKPALFLSRLCCQTFAGYAQSQVKKAKGLNKKIVNPVDKQRKSVTDFCYVVNGQGTIPLQNWLQKNMFEQQDCGLVNLTHMRDSYALYHRSQFNEQVPFRGICSGEQANDVLLSSVPAGVNPLSILSFNKDGYSAYCRDYLDYWNWTEDRNDARYQNTLDHGKNYDAKNMMHVFRLLNMAEEIALYNKVNVHRTDREYLLKIRGGEFMYEDLVKQADEKTDRIKELYAKSDLPNEPDLLKAEEQLIAIRKNLYKF